MDSLTLKQVMDIKLGASVNGFKISTDAPKNQVMNENLLLRQEMSEIKSRMEKNNKEIEYCRKIISFKEDEVLYEQAKGAVRCARFYNNLAHEYQAKLIIKNIGNINKSHLAKLLELIDNISEKIQDSEYKEIVDTMMLLNNNSIASTIIPEIPEFMNNFNL